MKKGYVKPEASVEEFLANEYVAACWGVGCDASDANAIEKNWSNTGSDKTKKNNYDGGQTHSSSHCGLLTNQAVEAGENGIATGMTECGTDGLGNLACTVYTNSTYNTVRTYASIKPGDKIYWTTAVSDGRVWHHLGTVSSTYPGHPNRS